MGLELEVKERQDRSGKRGGVKGGWGEAHEEGLTLLEVRSAVRAEQLYKIMQAILPRYRALRTILLTSSLPPPPSPSPSPSPFPTPLPPLSHSPTSSPLSPNAPPVPPGLTFSFPPEPASAPVQDQEPEPEPQREWDWEWRGWDEAGDRDGVETPVLSEEEATQIAAWRRHCVGLRRVRMLSGAWWEADADAGAAR
ncbi:hypothetical protein C8J57DRAFT_1374817 [Mycena rebaudengoi]|nr:hypothetical protein C8J57DRAFT_1374817 [Mycena rebaudengoi]